ncbi:hypothetical protein C0J52_16540 [Blattella germanica]|nr:hypothetical protein C0J52_16540 [Blattella germanica]
MHNLNVQSRPPTSKTTSTDNALSAYLSWCPAFTVCAEMTVTKHDCNWCTCLGGKVICTEISCPTFTTKKVTHDPDRVRDLFNIS